MRKKHIMLAAIMLIASASLVKSDTMTIDNAELQAYGSMYLDRWNSEDKGVEIPTDYLGNIGNAGASRQFRSIFEWDNSLFPVSSSSQINSVQLGIYQYSMSEAPAITLDHCLGDGAPDWAENFYPYESTYGEIVAAGAADGWVWVDVTDEIKADLDAGRDYSTFKLRVYGANGVNPVNSYRRYSGVRLTFDYTTVPEPATMSLLALGSVCAILKRRRK